MARTFNRDCERFGLIVARLARMYPPDEAMFWMLRRHVLLDGKRPVDIVMTEDADKITAILDRAEAGVAI